MRTETRIVENSLIPIYENEQGKHLVDSRELHSELGVKEQHSKWIKYQIERLQLIENKDFTLIREISLSFGGATSKHVYVLTLNAAKHIAMASCTEKGNEVRNYFIQTEEKLQDVQKRVYEIASKQNFELSTKLDQLQENFNQLVPILTNLQTPDPKKEFISAQTVEDLIKGWDEHKKVIRAKIQSAHSTLKAGVTSNNTFTLTRGLDEVSSCISLLR